MILKHTTSLLVIFQRITFLFGNAPTLAWVKPTGSGPSGYGNSVSLDSLGSVYITGHSVGTVDFAQELGTSNYSKK